MADTKISKMLKDEVVQASFAAAGIYGQRWTAEIQNPANPDDPTDLIPNPDSKQDFAFRMVEAFVVEIHGAEWDKNKKAEHEPNDAVDKQAEKDRIDNL